MGWSAMKFALLLVLELVLIVPLTFDGLTRNFMSDEPEFMPVQKASIPANSSHLTIVLGGTITRTSTLFAQMTPELRKVGDVTVINWAQNRFNQSKMVDLMVDYIAHTDYRTVAIVGASLGGNVAYDVQLKARRLKLKQQILDVLIATPPNASYISDWRARIPGWPIFPFGPIFNLISRPAIKAAYAKPEWEKLGLGHDRQLVEANLEANYEQRLSLLHDQMKSLRDAEEPKPGEAEGLKAAYVRCGRDIIVSNDAYQPFEHSYGAGFELIDLPDATHAGLLEYPLDFNREVIQVITEFKAA